MTTRLLLLGAALLFIFTLRPVSAAPDEEPAPAVESPSVVEEKVDTQVTAAKDGDAENDGQPDLDAAVSAKLAVQDLEDLSKVVRLSQRAIDKGLNAENKQFASKLLAAALLERAQAVTGAIFGPAQPDPRWRQMRDAALGDLRRALELDEQAPMHLLMVRLETLPGGDRKRAVEALDRAIEISDNDEETQFEALMIRAGTHEEVEQKMADYERAIELRPADAVPLRARGALKLSMEKTEEALEDFNLAIGLDPKHAATYEVRGMTLTMLGRLDEAEKSYAQAVELAPRTAQTLLQRAQVDLLTDNLEQAFENATEALELDGELTEAYLVRAQAAMKLERWEDALKDIDRLLSEQPKFVPARKARVTTLVGLKRTDEAIRQLEKLIDDDPRDMEVKLQLALLHRTQKHFTEAFSLFDSSIAIDPENWMFRYARGDALLSLGKHKEAISDYNVAVKLSPKNTGLLNNLAWVLSTSPVDELRDGKRAIELAKMAAELTNYQQANILSTLGAAYAEAGDLASAKEWCEKALAVADEQEQKELQKELASYNAGNPVRELQHEDDSALATPPEHQGVRR